MKRNVKYEPWWATIRPILDRVAVVKIDADERSTGGIIIPGGAAVGVKCERGFVFACGPDVKSDLFDKEVVYISGEARPLQELCLNGHEYSIIDEGDIQHVLIEEFDSADCDDED